jgi:hypothetical protein
MIITTTTANKSLIVCAQDIENSAYEYLDIILSNREIDTLLYNKNVHWYPILTKKN